MSDNQDERSFRRPVRLKYNDNNGSCESDHGTALSVDCSPQPDSYGNSGRLVASPPAISPVDITTDAASLPTPSVSPENRPARSQSIGKRARPPLSGSLSPNSPTAARAATKKPRQESGVEDGEFDEFAATNDAVSQSLAARKRSTGGNSIIGDRSSTERTPKPRYYGNPSLHDREPPWTNNRYFAGEHDKGPKAQPAKRQSASASQNRDAIPTTVVRAKKAGVARKKSRKRNLGKDQKDFGVGLIDDNNEEVVSLNDYRCHINEIEEDAMQYFLHATGHTSHYQALRAAQRWAAGRRGQARDDDTEAETDIEGQDKGGDDSKSDSSESGDDDDPYAFNDEESSNCEMGAIQERKVSKKASTARNAQAAATCQNTTTSSANPNAYGGLPRTPRQANTGHGFNLARTASASPASTSVHRDAGYGRSATGITRNRALTHPQNADAPSPVQTSFRGRRDAFAQHSPAIPSPVQALRAATDADGNASDPLLRYRDRPRPDPLMGGAPQPTTFGSLAQVENRDVSRYPRSQSKKRGTEITEDPIYGRRW